MIFLREGNRELISPTLLAVARKVTSCMCELHLVAASGSGYADFVSVRRVGVSFRSGSEELTAVRGRGERLEKL